MGPLQLIDKNLFQMTAGLTSFLRWSLQSNSFNQLE